MTKVFDAKHPIESFKALVLEMMKGYRFDVEGLYLKGGTVRPLPSEASVVGKVVEITIHEHLSRKLLQQRQLKSIPASSDRVYPDVSSNGPMIFPIREPDELALGRSGERRRGADDRDLCLRRALPPDAGAVGKPVDEPQLRLAFAPDLRDDQRQDDHLPAR
ncbi:MAG: hypothetical protein ABI689_00950 [Thermoanaerobaculia bacterium]